jgi:hypothetical protein
MESSGGFSDRVQQWMGHIPGIRTYEAREHRRETDKRLREHLAARLQEARSELSRLALDLGRSGDFEALVDLDRFSAYIQQIADMIRYASYGFSGVFAVSKIREAELDRLYAFDLALLGSVEEVHGLASAVRHAAPEARKDQILAGEGYLEGLEEEFRSRSNFLNQPQTRPTNPK